MIKKNLMLTFFVCLLSITPVLANPDPADEVPIDPQPDMPINDYLPFMLVIAIIYVLYRFNSSSVKLFHK